MPSASSGKLRFAVPLGLAPFQEEMLKKSGLEELYNLNQSDFFDIVTILYFAAANDPNPGALRDPKLGFDSFCELVTECLLAAPSQTLTRAQDDKGRYVNFFGKAIMEQLDPNIRIQDLYSQDGISKHVLAWEVVTTFVRFVAIDAFNRDLISRQPADIAAAQRRIQQLQDGTRRLKLERKKTFY